MKTEKFPFNTVIENGYCAEVTIEESKVTVGSWDVLIRVGLGDKDSAIKFTKKLRGRHKYE